MQKVKCHICDKLLLEAKVNSHIRKICPKCGARVEARVTEGGIKYNIYTATQAVQEW